MAVIIIIINLMQNVELGLRSIPGTVIKKVLMANVGSALLKLIKINEGLVGVLCKREVWN